MKKVTLDSSILDQAYDDLYGPNYDPDNYDQDNYDINVELEAAELLDAIYEQTYGVPTPAPLATRLLPVNEYGSAQALLDYHRRQRQPEPKPIRLNGIIIG